jgi:hypothetical protein
MPRIAANRWCNDSWINEHCHKNRSKKNHDQSTVTTQRKRSPPTQTPEWNSFNHKNMFRSRYVILKHTNRLDVMNADGTHQTTSTQTLLSPNAFSLAPTTTTKITFISPAYEPSNLYKQNHAMSNKPSCTLDISHPSTSTSQPSLHHIIKRKFGSQKACNLIKKSHDGQTSTISHTQSS